MSCSIADNLEFNSNQSTTKINNHESDQAMAISNLDYGYVITVDASHHNQSKGSLDRSLVTGHYDLI